MLKDALTQISALCVGAAALAMGDVSGGVAAATAGGGLAAVLIGRQAELRKERDRVFARVTAARTKQMESAGLTAAARRDCAAIDALFAAEAEKVLLNKAALIEGAFAQQEFVENVAETILTRLKVAEPDHTAAPPPTQGRWCAPGCRRRWNRKASIASCGWT